MTVAATALRGPVSQHRDLTSGERARDRIMSFILAYKTAHDGNSPTNREIADATDLTSTSVVAYHLYKLQEFGKILLPGHGKTRHIEVVGGQWSFNGEGNAPIRVLPIHSDVDQR